MRSLYARWLSLPAALLLVAALATPTFAELNGGTGSNTGSGVGGPPTESGVPEIDPNLMAGGLTLLLTGALLLADRRK
jgi:hypothetical protein